MKILHKHLIIIFLIFGLQSDWINETKKLIIETDNNCTIIKTHEIEDEFFGKLKTTEYKTSNINKTKLEFYQTKFTDAEINYYEKDDILIGEVIYGISKIIHKSAPKESDPYAHFIDSRTYFRNETEGIKMTRQINIYDGDEIQDIEKKLNKLDFEIKNLNKDDYINLRKKFERITNIEE